jgi:hypothetical protein
VVATTSVFPENEIPARMNGCRKHFGGRFPTEHPDPESPLPHFGLLVLDPHAVDFLEINGDPQNRWQFNRNDQGRWSGFEVNP